MIGGGKGRWRSFTFALHQSSLVCAALWYILFRHSGLLLARLRFILVVVVAEAFTARLQAAGVPEALAKAFVDQGYESEEDVSSSFISEVVFLRTVKSHLSACCTFRGRG